MCSSDLEVLRSETKSSTGILAFPGDRDKRNCGKMLVAVGREAVQRTMPFEFSDFGPLESRVEGDAAVDSGD